VLSLCLSRSCLGKTIVLIQKWRKKTHFLTASATIEISRSSYFMQKYSLRCEKTPPGFKTVLVVSVLSLSWQNDRVPQERKVKVQKQKRRCFASYAPNEGHHGRSDDLPRPPAAGARPLRRVGKRAVGSQRGLKGCWQPRQRAPRAVGRAALIKSAIRVTRVWHLCDARVADKDRGGGRRRHVV
jgi:hypothetical protein